MIYNLLISALGFLAIAVSIILYRNTSSKTARALTIIAMLFMLWDVSMMIINKDSNEFGQAFQEGVGVQVDLDDRGSVGVQIEMTNPDETE